MKRILIYSFCSLCSLLAVAQQINIKGTILDQSKNQALGFVSVALLKGDSLVKGTTSDEKGAFQIENIEKGSYVLKASFVGYETLIKKFNITGKNTEVNVGTLQMKEDAKMLKDVEVLAQGSQMKLEVDKKVFSVDQNIATAGGNVSEVLQNIPSVEVDNQGNISLRNSSSVEVWINGKPAGLTEENRAQILEQMPAGSVQSVEIITNPSAKYSPEGTAGIINLVLKEDRKAGYFGSVTTGIIYPRGSKLGELAGLNLNFNKGKVDAYFNVGFRNWTHQHLGSTDRYYLANNDTTSYLNQLKDESIDMYGVNGRFGINYRINEKHSLGLSGFGLSGKGNSEETLLYALKDSNDVAISDYNRVNAEAGYRRSGNTTLDYSWAIDKKGSELRSSLSYGFFQMGRDANYVQSIFVGSGLPLDQKQLMDGRNNNIQFKTDFIKKIKKETKIETGVDFKTQDRANLSSGKNRIGLDYIDFPSIYNNYVYKEQNYAIYATFGTKIKKLSIQGGLRGEYLIVNTSTKSALDIQRNQRDGLELFPSAFCAYTLTEKDELQLNYTRRINRPRGRQLNSFHDYSDSTNISYGNPNLIPELTSSFEFNYLKTYGKQQTLSASLYYRFTDNVIERIRFLDAGVMNSTYMNVTQSQSSGLELVSKNTIAKFLNLTTTVNAYYFKLIASDFVVSPSQTIHIESDESFSWDGRIMANFMLSKTFSGQITGRYSSEELIPQGKELAEFSMDLGFRKTFLKRKLALAFSMRNVFNTRKEISITSGKDFKQYYESYSMGPHMGLNLTYNFGNMDSKKKGKNKMQQGDDLNGDQDDIEDF